MNKDKYAVNSCIAHLNCTTVVYVIQYNMVVSDDLFQFCVTRCRVWRSWWY